MRPLLLLLACATATLADEPKPDPATLHLPADAVFVLRFAPPERLDAIGRELVQLAEVTGERRPMGDVILEALATRSLVDRSKPFYVAFGPEGATKLLAAAPGATAEQVEALGARRSGRFELLADGWIRMREGVDAGDRTEPLPLVAGDVSLVVPLGRLIARHRGKIDEAFANLESLDNLARDRGVAVPPAFTRFVKLLGKKVLRAIADLDDIHYALAWRGGRLESEGWIRTLERSSLRRWVEARKGTKPNDLIGLLPDRAFYMVESAGTASALDGDVAALLDEAFGEGAGRALLVLLSPSYALHDHLTGQAAGVVTVQGLMAMGMRSIHEVKPGAPIADAIAAIDVAKLNGLLGGLAEAKLERDFAKSGETPMHRMTLRSPIPEAGMWLGQMTTCFAVEGGYLLVAQSARAEADLRALLVQIRTPERKAHPHTRAMERLMPDRQEGLSINVGTLKPFVGLAAMAAPELAQVLSALPEDLWLSTALEVRDGNVHFRGDWPLKECLEFAAKVQKMDIGR